MNHDSQPQSYRVHGDVTLATHHFLTSIIATRPPFSVVFTDWLSMIAALGVGLLPSDCRTLGRSASWTPSHVPSSVHLRKYLYTVCQGGRSCGSIRHGHPVRSTYTMPLTTSRISTVRGRPPGLAGGSKGSRMSHCSSVRSLGMICVSYIKSNTNLILRKHPLSLGSNQLTGGVPPELVNLSRLESLRLYSNQLTGEIPTELGSLAKLETLSLSSNQLTGEIPTGLGSLVKLETLYLNSNQLTGEIPTELGNLAKLQNLRLGSNELTGQIPSELGDLSELQSLDLRSNRLTGRIPAELGNLSELETLYLSRNRLTGCIPAELRSVPTSDLDRLRLPFCSASAPVAPTIVAITPGPGSLTISWDPPYEERRIGHRRPMISATSRPTPTRRSARTGPSWRARGRRAAGTCSTA